MAPRSETLPRTERVDPAPAPADARPTPTPDARRHPHLRRGREHRDGAASGARRAPPGRRPRRRRRQPRRHRGPRRCARRRARPHQRPAPGGQGRARGRVPRRLRVRARARVRGPHRDGRRPLPRPGGAARTGGRAGRRRRPRHRIALRGRRGDPRVERPPARAVAVGQPLRGVRPRRRGPRPDVGVPRVPRRCPARRCGPRRTRSTGYAFQIELASRIAHAGLAVVEVPIEFNDRTAGTSKMSTRITIEALAAGHVVGPARSPPRGATRGMTAASPPITGARRRLDPSRAGRPARDRLQPVHRDALLLALVLIGSVLRLWALGRSKLNYDESFTAMAGRLPVGRLFAFLTAHDSHPPLDYLLHAPLARAGVGEFWFRLPSALCSIAALGAARMVVAAARSRRGRGDGALRAERVRDRARSRRHGCTRSSRSSASGSRSSADHWLRAPQRHHAPLIGALVLDRARDPRLDVPPRGRIWSPSPGSGATARPGGGGPRSSPPSRSGPSRGVRTSSCRREAATRPGSRRPRCGRSPRRSPGR